MTTLSLGLHSPVKQKLDRHLLGTYFKRKLKSFAKGSPDNRLLIAEVGARAASESLTYIVNILCLPLRSRLTKTDAMNFYPVPPEIVAELYVRIPDDLRCTGEPTEWRGGSALPFSGIFLEGPTTDEQGNLFVTDIPYGRILKIDPERNVSECVRWDGEPNGLVIRDDGLFVVADYKQVLYITCF